MHDERTIVWCASLVAALLPVSLAPAGSCGAELVIGAEPGAGYYGVVAGLGDVNGDGIPDFAVGAMQSDFAGLDTGRVYVYAGGSSPTLLYTLDGITPFALFGDRIRGLGDVDGDGRGDFAVAATGSNSYRGRVTIHSGADGHVLFAYAGVTPGDFLGSSLGGGGDVNGDGRPDFAIGGWGWDDPILGVDVGKVEVRSGADGTLLYTMLGGLPGDQLGSAVTILGDQDGDGHAEFAVGAAGFDADDPTVEDDYGRVTVHDGADGRLRAEYVGQFPYDAWGVSLSVLGDVNADGVVDWAIGGYRSIVVSGLDGALLAHPAAPTIWAYGFGVGDFDGDGSADILYRRFTENPGQAYHLTPHLVAGPGSARGTDRVLGQVVMPDFYFWEAPTPLGDMNLDGFSDLLVGFPVNGGAGEVHILFGGPRPSPDLDGSGSVDAGDLGLLLGAWGKAADPAFDLDASGSVDACDFELLFLNWG